jgi:hypothetical protein
MSLSARMLIAYRQAIREGRSPQHHFAWEHCSRVLASSLIGAGA